MNSLQNNVSVFIKGDHNQISNKEKGKMGPRTVFQCTNGKVIHLCDVKNIMNQLSIL
jgi:hypothetical protein